MLPAPRPDRPPAPPPPPKPLGTLPPPPPAAPESPRPPAATAPRQVGARLLGLRVRARPRDVRGLRLAEGPVLRERVRHLDLLERRRAVDAVAHLHERLEDLAHRLEQLLGGPAHHVEELAGALVALHRHDHRLRRRLRGV